MSGDFFGYTDNNATNVCAELADDTQTYTACKDGELISGCHGSYMDCADCESYVGSC